MPVVGARNVEAVAAEGFAGGANSVEFVGLRAIFAGLLAWPIELDHPLAGASQRGGETAAAPAVPSIAQTRSPATVNASAQLMASS